MNKVILMGRLTRDPDIRPTKNGKTVARYTLAVDKRFRLDNDDQKADFIPCIAFGKGAEFAEKWLHQGTKITACGYIKTGSYMKDGQRVYTVDVVIEEQEFAEGKKQTEAIPDDFVEVSEDFEQDGLPFR